MSKKSRIIDHMTQPRSEILLVVESVAREKSITKEEVLEALEDALQSAAIEKYGANFEVHTSIHPQTGDISIFRRCLVVDHVEDRLNQISLEDALKRDPSATLGGTFIDKLPTLDFGRVEARNARGIVVERIRIAERRRQFEDFDKRRNQIVSALVKRIEFGSLVVDLGGGCEGIIRQKDRIPRELFRVGDRIRGIVADLRPHDRGPLVIMSRTHPDFMRRLFEQEVPEVYDGVVEIKGIARDPGSRSKISVYTSDQSIDPVGACVGPKGARIHAVMAELRGEKIDVIPWSSNIATYVVNALAPAEVLKIVVDEGEEAYEIVVDENQLSLAIGRKGQNVRLVNKLTGARISVVSQDEASRRQLQETSLVIEELSKQLLIDDITAQLLVLEGFTTVEEISFVDFDEFSQIDGLSEELARELQTRARFAMETQELQDLNKLQELGVSDTLVQLGKFDVKTLLVLAESGIKDIEDFATLSPQELCDLVGEAVFTEEGARQFIEEARLSCGEDINHGIMEDDGS